jgi:hypothetical protein
MKRIAYTLSLVAATALAAAPLAAQSGNGPWWDPGRTQTRTTPQGGQVYGRNGSVYDQADGQWRADGQDRNGNTVYVRTRYDSNGQLVREWATRNIIGRYNIIDRQYLNNGNGTYGNNRGVYDNRGVYNSNGRYDTRAQEEQRKAEEKYRRDQLKAQREYEKRQQKIYEEQQRQYDKQYGKGKGPKDKDHGRGKGHDR